MERIKEELQTPFVLNNNEIFITVSAGITSSEKCYNYPEDAILGYDFLGEINFAVHKDYIEKIVETEIMVCWEEPLIIKKI